MAAVVSRPRAGVRLAPVIGLVGGMVLLALLVGLVGVQVTTWAQDETLFKQSALHYASGLPGTFFNDDTARATARLYPLILMPVFKALAADDAIRVAKVITAILWASAAVPAWLLARRVVPSPWGAVAVALLGVATPWAVLGTALMTETLALVALLWSVHAMVRAAEAPSPRRDLAVLAWLVVAILSRTQLFALVLAWLAVVVVLAVRTPGAGPVARARALARRLPFSTAAVVVVPLVILLALTVGPLRVRLHEALGTYTFDTRGTLPADVPLGLAVEVLALGLGMGVLPLVLAVLWAPRALRDPRDAPAWTYALVATAAVVALAAFTLAAQSGYLGTGTEERYFFYLVPLLWIGAGAAVAGGTVTVGRLARGVAAFAVLAGVVVLPRELDVETILLAPAQVTANRLTDVVLGWSHDVTGLLGPARRDALVIALLLVAAALLVAGRRARWGRMSVVLGAAGVVQLLLAGYALLAVDGHVAGGLAKRTGGTSLARQAWIDHAVGRGVVTWLDNDLRESTDVYPVRQRGVLFFNDRIRSRLALDGAELPVDANPLDALPLTLAHLAPADGALSGLPATIALSWRDSPFAQVQGRPLAQDPSGSRFELLRVPAVHPRASWLASGLASTGAVLPDRPVAVRAWSPSGAVTAQVRVAIPAGVAGTARLRLTLGSATRTVALSAGQSRVVALRACGAAVRGELRPEAIVGLPDGTATAGIIDGVHVVQDDPGRCRR